MHFTHWFYIVLILGVMVLPIALMWDSAGANNNLPRAQPVVWESYGGNVEKFSDGPIDCYVGSRKISCVKAR